MSITKTSVHSLIQRFSEISSKSKYAKKDNNILDVNKNISISNKDSNLTGQKYSTPKKVEHSIIQSKNLVQNSQNKCETSESQKSSNLTLKQQIDVISKITQKPMEQITVCILS